MLPWEIRRLDPGPDPVPCCVTSGKSVHSSGPQCALVSNTVGRCTVSEASSCTASLVPGVLPGHPEPHLGFCGWAVQAGQAGVIGKNRAAGPNPSLHRSSLLAVLYSFLALKVEPRTTAGGWGPHRCPKGRSEPVWERGVRGLRPDGSIYPSLARNARAAVDAGNCSLAGGEGRRRGKQAGPQREAKEGKLNVRAKDQDDRWYRSCCTLPARRHGPVGEAPGRRRGNPGEP